MRPKGPLGRSASLQIGSPSEWAGMRARRCHADLAVSPVVGMVLVLAISIVGITVVLVWGLPAINEMKAGVEHQAVATQLQEFNSDVLELAKATASKTAKVWRVSQSQGQFNIEPATERWTIGVDAKSKLGTPPLYNFTIVDVEDTDNKISIRYWSPPGAPNVFPFNLKADFLDASTTIPLTVVSKGTADGACATTATGGGQTVYVAGSQSFDGGERRWFCLYDSAGKPISVSGRLLQVEIINHQVTPANRETAAVFWITDTGRAHWQLSTANGLREAYVSNGVVFQGTNGGLVLDGNPPIAAPVKQAGAWRFFSRLVTVNGTVALGGQGTVDILLNLYGSRTLADEFSATGVKIRISGDLATAWRGYLFDPTHKYNLVEHTDADGKKYYLWVSMSGGSRETVKALLHHSVVSASG